MLAERPFTRRPAEPASILLVEDDAQFAELVRAQLRRMPWVQSRLEVVATLRAALAKLEAESFGLVLCDLNLPDSKGLDTVAALLRAGDQPVIVLSGDPSPATRAGVMDSGAFDFLSKDNLSASALERLVRLAVIQANTQRLVHESEERFRGLIKLSSDFYWESDAEHRVIKLEHGSERHSAVNPGQVGRARWELPSTYPDAAGWAAHRATMQAHLPFRDFEIARRDDDGFERWRSLSGEPMFDARGRFQGYRGVGRDVTEGKRAQEELQRFRLAMDASADIIVLIERATMRFVDVNRTACDLLGYTRQELLALGPQDVLPVSRAQLEKAYDEFIANPGQMPGMNSYYLCKDGSQLPFESTRHVLRSGTGWIIAAISRDIRDRNASEAALRESEARKSAILDAAMDAVITIDHTGRILEFNAAAERHFGFERKAAVGKDIAELIIPPELREQHRKGLARYIAHGESRVIGSRIEVPALRADGTRIEVELAIVRIPGSEPPVFTGTARDITERKHDELLKRNAGLALRESEARFRSLIELSSDFYWETDVRHRVMKIHHGSAKQAVVNPAQLGHTRWDTPSFHPDAAGWAAHRAMLDAHLPFRDFEIGRVAAHGVERWRSLSGEPVFDAEGVFRGYRGIGKDVTAAKQAEEELRRFRLAMDNSADMIVLIDRASMRFVDVNRTVCDLLGYSREEMLALGPQDVLPMDREQLAKSYDDFIANPAHTSGMKSYYRCKDGSHLPFESTRRVLRSGNRWIIAAVSRDIRERIAAEKALRQSEERFRSLNALSSDWYWEQDAEFRLTFMSSIQTLGLDASKYIGFRRWDQPALNLTEDDWARHRAQLERHEPFHDFEVQRSAPDGGSVWLSLSGEPVFDEHKHLVGYRGIGRDITQRKRSEQHVAQLGRMYAALGAANEAILRATSPQEVFERACEIAVGAGDFLLGTVFLLDAQTKAISRAAASGVGATGVAGVLPSIDAAQPGGKGLVGHACRTGERAITNDYEADPRTRGRRSADRGYEIGSSAVFPLRVEGELVGVFALQHAKRDAFSDELVNLLQRLADNISFALENFRVDKRRRKVKRKLAESEERFRSLTNLSSDVYWEQDAELRFTVFTESRPGQPSVSKTALLGKRRWDMDYLNMSAEDWARHRAMVEAHQPFHDLELCRVEKGAPVWISTSGEPILDAQGNFQGYRGVGKDITARKREERLVMLEHHVARILAAAESSLAAVEGVIRALCESEGWPVGRYFTADDAAGVLSFAGAWGISDAAVEDFIARSRSMTYRRGHGLTGHVWLSGEPLWAPDAMKDRRASGSGQPSGKTAGMRGSSFVFPVQFEGRTIGVLSLSSGEVRQPDERLLRTIKVIGSQFGQFLQRKRAEQAASESAARFQQTFELAASGMAHVGLDGRFLQVNRRLCEMLGYSDAELIGRSVKEISHPEDRDATDVRRALMRSGELPSANFEKRYLRKDGAAVWVNLTVALARNAHGEPQYEISVLEDVTARKRAEQLRELEHSVTRSLAEASGVEEALRAAIAAVCRAEGWECGRYFSPDPKAGNLRFRVGWGIQDEEVQRYLAGSRTLTYNAGVGLVGRVWSTGEPIWVQDLLSDPRVSQASLARDSGIRGAFVFPVVADARTIGVLAFNSHEIRTPEDALLQAIRVVGSQIGQVLQRTQAEDVMRESEERFRSLTKLSSDWYWEQDAELRFTKFEGKGSDESYVPGAAVLGKPIWELPGLEQVDWREYRRQAERHEAFRDLEYSYRDRAGRRFYISVDGEPMFDAEGVFSGYRGTSRDVTRQRRDEEALRRFRAAMDMSIDAIYLTDRATMRFIDVNEAACRGVRRKREELLEMGPEQLLLMSREELERGFDALIANPAEGTRSERSYTSANGNPRWTEIHSRALRTGDRWIIVTISRDISERKVAEQRQAQHLRHQERIARFGQSAIARREPPELIEEAVQNVLEGLAAESVAYFERGTSEGALVLRSLVGARDPAAAAAPGAEGPVLAVLDSGERRVIDGGQLGLPWTKGLGSVALVPVRGEREARGVLCVGYAHADAFSAESFNFIEAAASVLSAGLQRIDSEGRLAYLAQFDPLTGLPNRALLADRFSQMIVQATRHDSLLAVLFIDLDEFKAVNDTLGHAGGDDLLKETAVRLQSCVRSGDTVARISGDEFAVVLADLAKLEDAALVAQKIIDRVGAACEIHGHEVFVTASVGIAAFPGDGADAETLIGAADAAMYRAKQSGRNSYQFFTSEINQRSRARALLGTELRRALERDEFALAYQPKYRLTDRKPQGAEALLRWKHPERGIVSPMEFIPVLEETGLIVPVGEWVLARACEDIKAWAAAGLDAGPIAVNLSARQFRQQDLDARLKAVIAKSGVSPTLIEMEITESQLMQDPDHAIKVMRSLADAGIKIVIDDFGTGYSSLSYLTRFPVGTLKIDRSFVAKANQDPSSATIVRTIIEMAHSLGFTVVAEGVETEDQATFLRLLRCEQAQGYLFARPAFEPEFRKLIQKAN